MSKILNKNENIFVNKHKVFNDLSVMVHNLWSFAFFDIFSEIDFQDDEFNFQQPLPAEPGENHTEGRSSRSETPSFSTNPLKNMKNYIIRILPGNV